MHRTATHRPDPAARRRALSRAGALALLALGAAPTRGVAAQAGAPRLIVPYPRGAPADLVARQLASALQRQTGAHAVVEHLPGAGGAVGIGRLLAGRASGWLVGTPGDAIVAPLANPALGYAPEQLRLAGVASVVEVVLAARADAEAAATTLARARRDERPLLCGNDGVGWPAHLAALAFAAQAEVPLIHVPYNGLAPMLRELVAGRLDIAFVPLQRGVLELESQRRLQFFGLAAARRDTRWPALPTLDEATGAAGIEHRLWTGLFVPADDGPRAATQVRHALAAALGDDTYRAQKTAEGARPGWPMSADEAERWQADEIDRYRRLVAAMPRTA